MSQDSILHSSMRALFMAFFTMIGICFGILAVIMFFGVLSSSSTDSRLKTVSTEEILPNAKGKREVVATDAPVILQVNIKGIIGAEDLSAKSVRQILVESREGDLKDNRVKGILLHIDSPGGTVTDSAGIYEVVNEYKKKYQVPVYAYVDGLCASGGMYIASAADKVFASDVSLIGSVGVIAPTFMNISKLLERFGVESLTISAGKDKDAMNPLRPWKPDEDANYRHIINYYYNSFVDLVISNRPQLSKQKLVEDYGARIFPAEQALEYGYIDVANATISDTLNALLKAANIEGDSYQVIRLENKEWWKDLFSSQSPLFTGKITHKVSVSPVVDLLMQNQYLYLYNP